MKILDRYIIREIIASFLVCLFAFTGILLTLKMLRFASLVVNKGVELYQIGKVFLTIIPTFLEIAIPLSVLLGIMHAFARLSGDSEIVVMRASGISIYQLLKPVLFFGLVATLLGLVVSLALKPWGYRELSKTLFHIARSQTTSGLEQGIFNKLGSLTLYAEYIDHFSGKLQKVLIDDRRNTESRKIVLAKTGTLVSDENQKSITIYLHQGDIHEIIDGNYVLTRYVSNNIVLKPEEIFDAESFSAGKHGQEMNLRELGEERNFYSNLRNQIEKGEEVEKLIDFQGKPLFMDSDTFPIESINRKIGRLDGEISSRFSLPFASLCLALLALPLGIQPPRTQKTWGLGLSSLLGLLVFVFYYGLFSLGFVLTQSGVMDAKLALWLPNLGVVIIGGYLLQKTGSEAWQSVAYGFEGVVRRIGGYLGYTKKEA